MLTPDAINILQLSSQVRGHAQAQMFALYRVVDVPSKDKMGRSVHTACDNNVNAELEPNFACGLYMSIKLHIV